MRKNKFENTLSLIGIFISIAFLLLTITLAIYTGYSQKKIIDDTVLEKRNDNKVLDSTNLHENLVLKSLGVRRKDYSGENYEKMLIFHFHALLFLASLYTSIFAFIAYNRFKRQLKRDQSIQSFSINNEKHEDLHMMLQYYKGADNVIVYSGDFSWIKENKDLQGVVLSLSASSKIKLHSSKKREIVENSIGLDILEKLEANNLISFEKYNEHNIRCSLIECAGEFVFLYKVKTASPPHGLKYTLCLLTEKKDSKYLLKTIERLMKKE